MSGEPLARDAWCSIDLDAWCPDCPLGPTSDRAFKRYCPKHLRSVAGLDDPAPSVSASEED